MIDVKHLTKSYLTDEGPLNIFEDTHFEVKTGDFVSIMWPSGSGKSTFFNLLAGLDTAQSGSIVINGTDIVPLSNDQRTVRRGKNIGFVFQDFHLIPSLTVAENIDLVLSLNGLTRRYETEEILDQVGILAKKDTYPFHLSGGEQQRVALARAFVGDLPLILADEPTGNLDEANTKKILDLLLGFQKKTGTTIVMITHEPDIAKESQKTYTIQHHHFIPYSH